MGQTQGANSNAASSRTPQEGAEAARQAGREIADLVYSKQLAYGDASGIQHEIWKVLLKQYLTALQPTGGNVATTAHGCYLIPVELMDHIPRLTRVFDRICRIVSNPAADRMGEDPWRDLAGDALCGIVMPRTTPQRQPQVQLSYFYVHGEKVGAKAGGELEAWLVHRGYPSWEVGNDLAKAGVDLSGPGVGEDPIETAAANGPHPAQTRIWNEAPLGGMTASQMGEVAYAAQKAAELAEMREGDMAFAEHLLNRKEQAKQPDVQVPPVRVVRQATTLPDEHAANAQELREHMGL